MEILIGIFYNRYFIKVLENRILTPFKYKIDKFFYIQCSDRDRDRRDSIEGLSLLKTPIKI